MAVLEAVTQAASQAEQPQEFLLSKKGASVMHACLQKHGISKYSSVLPRIFSLNTINFNVLPCLLVG